MTAVTFSLPSLAAAGNGEIDEPSPQNVARAMGSARVRRDHAGRGDNDLRDLRAGGLHWTYST